MTKFEEEVKRPDNTGIDPFSKRDVDFSKLAAKFARAAQTLKKWREYAGYLEYKVTEYKDDAINESKLRCEEKAKHDTETSELERENQRLVAENSAIKTLVDNANQQQALPVVPECADVAIKSLPDDYSAFEAISLINAKIDALPEENKDWLPVFNWLCDDIKNQDIFALAFITGKYQVEKPQLFYLKNKLTGDCLAICLARASSGLYVEVTEKWLTRIEQTSYKLYFTQQEIDSMQTGSYEQIPVPVEDGE